MNDDVFNDDEDEAPSGGDSAPAQEPKSNFSQHANISANGKDLPGYLIEALEKYVRQHGFSDRNKRIPQAALVFSELSTITRQIYRPDASTNAVAAMWRVLNQITDGGLQLEFEKIQLEEKVAAYDYLSNIINRVYAELEEHVEEIGFEETTRLGRMLMVYFDILRYHQEYFTEEYVEFCYSNGFVPDEIIVEQKAFEHDHPWMLSNLILFKIHNPEQNELKGSLAAWFNELIDGVSKYARNLVVGFDRSNLAAEQK